MSEEKQTPEMIETVSEEKIPQPEIPPKKKKNTLKKRLARKLAASAAKSQAASGEKTGEAKKKENKSKPKDMRKTAKRLFSYLKESRGLLVLVFIMVIFYAVVSVGTTAINEPIVNLCKQVIDTSSRPERAEFISKIAMWLSLMIGLSVVSAAFSYIYSKIMLKVSQRTMRIMRKELFDHIEKLPISYFDTNKRGDIMARFTSDISAVNDIINSGITTLISSGFTLIGSVAMMIYYSPVITLVLFGSVIVILIVVVLIGGLSAKQFRKFRKANGAATAHVEEYIRGQRVVKVFGHEEDNKAQYSQLANRIRKVGIGANTISGLIMPITDFISQINYALCALLGAGMIIAGKGSMNIGRLVAYLSYARSFTSPITSLASQFSSLMSALAGAERIFEILDMPPEIDEGTVKLVRAILNEDGTYTECDDYGSSLYWKVPLGADEYVYTPVKGRVDFNDVSFAYVEDKTVLKHINLQILPNEKVAFVGSTGAGKTTVTNLLSRFYDIEEGEILVDGINVKAIEKPSLRKSMALVLQDTRLFSGTVRENIRYGRPEATDEEIEEAAKIANAHSFIERMPGGYEFVLKGDGKNLSQGQRQLLSIARAVIADPEILVLDEATSSIDTRTEKLIEKGMDALMQDRTVLIVAHRLSTVRNSDKILVLEHGEIIEQGNHDELLALEGKYYQLYNGMYELD